MAELDLDSLDSSNARYKPLTPAQRLSKQRKFLTAYSRVGIVKVACKAAGISRQTYYAWRDKDAAFKTQLPDVEQDANEALESAAYDRAVQGVPSFVVSMGRMVYEEIPVLNKDGTPKLDHEGKQIMLRGKPLIERKYSDSLLTTLLKARMPEKYKERLEHTGKDNGPIQVEGLIIDTRNLSAEQLELLKSVAQTMKEREQ